ncbi:MAG: aminotransferase class I/II-fold pyridoxal phosphate-dependent enzyme [Muribaculaceae bacterium]|nr:aminotransferase class I/II-fold pyridoxal phosphate-dependent enzyme [Muribaculaceae bacterium]
MKTIQPSNRVNNVKPYYFAGKLREVAQLNARGYDIISLGIGGPDRMPPEAAINALCEAAHRSDVHSYQPFAGLPELRRAMADWYDRVYGVKLDPETELLPLMGSKEGIMHISMAFLNPGDGVLVPNPGYPTYTSVSKLVEAEIFPYDLTAENSWQPDFEALEKLPLDRIKLMWVNYPHMPTGAPASKELLQKIVDFGRKHNIVIAHDNPYSHILNDEPLSILAADGAREICIEMNSLSKSHNMAGWRMAMVATNPTFLQWIVKVKSNVDSGQFKPVMLAAVEALRQGPEWSRELNRHYAERRRVAEEIMSALGCTFDPAQRGMFLWGKLPDSVADPEAFVDDILYNRRVFITPGFIFGSNGRRYIRISLCATVETLRRALDRLR